MLGDVVVVGRPGQVRLSDDPDAASIRVDDRNAPHLPVRHRALHRLDVVVGAAARRVRRHDFAYFGFGDLSFREGPNCEVPVGDDAEDSAGIVDNRQAAAVVVTHHSRDILQ